MLYLKLRSSHMKNIALPTMVNMKFGGEYSG
jgi:hypothetical protein